MARARFSIGIDLGTTNSALAFAPLLGEAKPELMSVPQWESLTRLAEGPTLPSFLYLPEEAVAAQLARGAVGAGEWVLGRLARTRAGETPGRVIHSAKSWLCHHAADRSAPFLPWASEDLPREQKISPVRASALILSYLRQTWDSRFAAAGFAFDDQEITVTVPASFDAAAQRLTLAAAEQAGFPDGVRLLEEPQAAFYCWLEHHDPARELWPRRAEGDAGPWHVLVIDIGGGTSDFSLFKLRLEQASALPDVRRVAVSEHILLGGDNIDLAIAHFVEARLAGGRGQLAGTQWDQLVASCRDLKERALSDAGLPDERFAVAFAARGSGLVAGSQVVTVTRAEIERVLLDGFFPACDAAARPYRTAGALREWGLPYASDSAVTRHLADFLRDRPRIDAVLFNGGSVTPKLLRQRLREQIAAWQDGAPPLELANAEPDLAVARGAARFGALANRPAGRIAAGAARAIFLEVQGAPTSQGDAVPPSLVCVLPRGAAAEQAFEIAEPALDVRTDQLVRFQAYSSSRHGRSRAGDVLTWREGEFHALPALQTVIRTSEPGVGPAGRTMPVHLLARMNALGLLQVSCISADPANPQSWPLEFNLRPYEQASAGAAGREPAGVVEPNAAADALQAARRMIGSVFAPRRAGSTEKLTAGAIVKSLERILGVPRNGWNAPLLRALWPDLEAGLEGRRHSVEHEEAWLALAGFLLRPGFGVAGDELRMDSLWRALEPGPCFPGRRIKVQEYLLWRRVVGGLSEQRQGRLIAGERERLLGGKAPGELVRLAGSLELLSHQTKVELVDHFITRAVTLARGKQHSAPYLAALGHLLNRAPLHAGPETVVSPDLVERAFEAFHRLDWAEPELLELQTLFLRAARVVGDRSLDVPPRLRNAIAAKLEKSGVAPSRTARIKAFVPIGRSERASLYDESLPPGLVMGAGQDGAQTEK
jgi:molecular chaperone DnaK (HSP70)